MEYRYNKFRSDEDFKGTGVYMMIIGSCFYIGSVSGSRHFYQRWNEHITSINNGTHQSLVMQAVRNSHGGTITFKILERCDPDRTICRKREQYWLNVYGYSLNIRQAFVE